MIRISDLRGKCLFDNKLEDKEKREDLQVIIKAALRILPVTNSCFSSLFIVLAISPHTPPQKSIALGSFEPTNLSAS
jgi:hypothetical protein